jgi:hypothetical protein
VATDATSNPFDLTRQALTWSGGGDGVNWSDADNWKEKLAPTDGDSLIFPTGSAPRDSVNDVAGLSLSKIDFKGSGYDLTGLPITVTAAVSSTGDNMVEFGTLVSGTVTMAVLGGTLQFKDQLAGDGNLTVSGAQESKLLLKGGNSLTGVTTIASGTVQIGDTLDHEVWIDGGTVVLLAGLAGTGPIDVRRGVLFSDQALDGYSGDITIESAASGGSAGDRAQVVVEANNALGSGTVTVSAGAGNWGVIQASGEVMTEVGRLSIDNNIVFEAGASLGVLGSIRLLGEVALGGDNALLPQAGAWVEFANEVGLSGMAAMSIGPFAGRIEVGVAGSTARYSVTNSGLIAANTQIIFNGGQVGLGGELGADVEATDQVVIDGATVELLEGLRGDGGIDVRKGVLVSDQALPDYSGDVTIEASATGSGAGDRAQVVVEAAGALGSGVIKVAAGSGNWGVLQASGDEWSDDGPLTLSNEVAFDDGAALGILGTLRLAGPIDVTGRVVLRAQTGAMLDLAGAIRPGGDVAIAAAGGYAGRLIVAATEGASGAGAVRISGAVSASEQIVFQAGKDRLGGTLGAPVDTTDQVVIDGATVDLFIDLAGQGGIDVVKGVLYSEVTPSNYSGTITLESTATGSAAGDRAQAVFEGDNAFGSGPIVVATGSGNWPVLQASGGLMLEQGRLTLMNDVSFQPGSALGVLGLVRLNGSIALDGESSLKPQADSWVELTGGIGGGSVASAASTSVRAMSDTVPSSPYLGRLVIAATEGATATGSVTLSGTLAAGSQLVVQAGETWLGGEVAASAGSGDQVVVDGAKVHLTAELSGNGGIVVRRGILRSDEVVTGYHGAITIEQGRVIVSLDGALGDGPILKTTDGPCVLMSDTSGTDPVVNNPLTVAQGSLILRGLLSFPRGVSVSANGTLVVDGNDTFIIWPGSVDGDGLIVLSSGTLRISNSNNGYACAFEQTGGTLELLGAHSLRSTTVGVRTDHGTGAVYIDTITLLAVVTAVDAKAGTPTGLVQFLVDGIPTGAPVAVEVGTASLATHLGAGTHLISAGYLSDDAAFADGHVLHPRSQTVARAPLTIIANDARMTAGGSWPVLSASYIVLVNGDTAASLSSPTILTTDATAASSPGLYVIRVAGATSADYDITYQYGTLTVDAAAGTPLDRARLAYVESLYEQILSPTAEPSGLVFWTNRLARGASLHTVAVTVWRSREHRQLVTSHQAPHVGLVAAYRNAVRAYLQAYRARTAVAAVPGGPRGLLRPSSVGTVRMA